MTALDAVLTALAGASSLYAAGCHGLARSAIVARARAEADRDRLAEALTARPEVGITLTEWDAGDGPSRPPVRLVAVDDLPGDDDEARQ